MSGLYWHFVDIVWIFLFPLLYLLGAHHVAHGGPAHVPRTPLRPSAPTSRSSSRCSCSPAATYVVATHDFGVMNTPIALAVALLKASLVVIYFMGVRYNTPLTKVVVVAGFFWLFILFGLTLNDYLTRAWMGVAGR